MRLRHATCALICAFLITAGSGLLGECSLASYSETRSFRDALDGRSMEDAISGPVDRDSSSYGDRTAATSSGANQQQQEQISASPMMFAIPANGNMNDNVQQQQMSGDEQQKVSANGSGNELERESTAQPTTGATDDGALTTTTEVYQQKMLEQKSGRQVQRQPASTMMMMRMNGRSAAPGSAPIPKPAATMGPARSQRQQQKQLSESGNEYRPSQMASGTKGGSGAGDSGFGEDQPTTPGAPAAKGGPMRESRQPGQQRNTDAGLEQQQQRDQDGGEQQMDGVGGQAKGYASMVASQDMLAKQQAVAAMLMNMSNGMKYSQANAAAMQRMRPSTTTSVPPTMSVGAQLQQGYGSNGKKQMTNSSPMAQSMLMSLANKAAYMGMQQQLQKQLASSGPQMSAAPQMKVIPANGSVKRANQQQTDRAQAAPQLSGAPRGGMRRANQRKVDRKMSPSMVNAMLNKMMQNVEQVQAQEPEQVAQRGGYTAKQQNTMAMLMKSPAGAEMLANIMMAQMSDAAPQATSRQQSGNNLMQQTAKREQYKRMMMATAMQQQQQVDAGKPIMQSPVDPESQQQQQQLQQNQDGSYGQKRQKPMMGSQPAKAGKGYSTRSNGAKPKTGPSAATTMSPMAMILSMMEQQQQPQGMYKQQAGPVEDQTQQQMMDTSSADRLMSSKQMQAMKPMQTASRGYDNQSPDMQATDKPKRGSYGGAMMTPVGRQSATKRGGPVNKPMESGNGYAAAPAVNAATMSPMEMMMMSMMNNGDDANQMPDTSSMSYKKNGAGAGAMKRQPPPPPSMGAINGNGYAPAAMNPANMMEQQRDRSMMAKSMMNSDDVSSTPPAAPMNGFRQALAAGQPQRYKQQQVSEMTSGTKTGGQQQEEDEASTTIPSINSVARPASVLPASAARDAQQTTDDDERPASQAGMSDNDSYGRAGDSNGEDDNGDGAAPMGQAEPFAFDYKIEDKLGNGQYRKEESDKNGVVRGSYGYTDVSGIYRHVEYVADEKGFRANIKSNEPGLNGSAGGADGASSMGDDSESGSMDGDGSAASSAGRQSQPATDSSSSSALGNPAANPMQVSPGMPMPMPLDASGASGTDTADEGQQQQMPLEQQMQSSITPANQQQQLQQQELSETGEK